MENYVSVTRWLDFNEGSFKCYVAQWGVGGCQISRKIA